MGSLNFGQFLTNRGNLSKKNFLRAKSAETETGVSFARVLTDLGLIGRNELFSLFKTFYEINHIEAADFPEKIPNLNINPGFLKAHNIIPLKDKPNGLLVATSDPTDEWPLQAISFAVKKQIIPVLANANDIAEKIEKAFFGRGPETTEEVLAASQFDLERLTELASDAPVIRYVDRMLDYAVEHKASDIHLEPQSDGLKIRMRQDGMLSAIDGPPPSHEDAILSRVKILAGLDISETRLPQDGRFRQTVRGKEIDIRVSTVPTLYGETVTLRILDKTNSSLEMDALGLAKGLKQTLQNVLAQPEGIILVTGPTGSGKTTTLYAALKYLNKPEIKILTVEDPIEYAIEGINQVGVEPKIGRTFSSTLRSFLRQDPDIIMVGEIRDSETAQIAVQAAQTGHLVLSTLHTNDAATAFIRLRDLGLAPYLIASSVSMAMGQRLVRLLCNKCKVPITYRSKDFASLDSYNFKPFAGFKPKGCSACRNTGFSGRHLIAEILEVTDVIRSHLLKDSSARTIEQQACKLGMKTMMQDGLHLVQAGKTSLDEVLRVTRDNV